MRTTFAQRLESACGEPVGRLLRRLYVVEQKSVPDIHQWIRGRLGLVITDGTIYKIMTEHGIPRRGYAERKRISWKQGKMDASMAKSRQTRKRTYLLGSKAEQTIRYLLREALLVLEFKWDVVIGDHLQHILGRYEVDIPVVVVDRATGVACRFAVEVDNRFTHSTPKRRKRDAAKDRALGEAGWKVCRVDGGANNHVLAEQVADLALAMESHAAETFVNQSFRSSPEGSGAVQLTFGDCVQGGYCRLTVSSFCECRSRGGNERAALEDRSFPTTFADSESFDSFLEGVVDQVGVDLRGGEVPVSEGPFDHQDIAGAAVEVGGEGVPQTVGTDALADARFS